MTSSRTDNAYRGYQRHYERMRNRRPSEEVVPEIARVDGLKPWMRALPRDARILDCGCGFGHQLLALRHLGFVNLHGIELSEGSFRVATEELGGTAVLELGDALEFLPRHRGEFDAIILNDVLEHFPPDRTMSVLESIAEALKPGGILHVRVPNMSSLLAPYSMHLDITHLSGFTEYSLMQALENAGFVDPRVVSSRPRLFWSPTRPARMALRLVRIAQWLLDRILHRGLYLLRGQLPMPVETSINVEVYATKAA